jgi:iron transport multicopper oxidase
VVSNATYRLRIVNAGSLGYFNFAIAGHTLTVIAMDAMPKKALVVNSIDIASGQRVDVLLQTKMSASNYSIGVITNWRGNDTTAAGGGYAVLHYQGANTYSSELPPPPE